MNVFFVLKGFKLFIIISYLSYKIAPLPLKRGITGEGEFQTRKKYRSAIFFKRNPYMKYEDPSFNFLEWTDG